MPLRELLGLARSFRAPTQDTSERAVIGRVEQLKSESGYLLAQLVLHFIQPAQGFDGRLVVVFLAVDRSRYHGVIGRNAGQEHLLPLTFLPLFPSPPYAGRNALLAPANLIQVSPTFRASLKRVTLFLDSPFAWRSSTTDGIYNFADILIRTGNRTDARSVGAHPGGQIDVHLNRHWTAGIQYSHFFAGEFLKKTPPGKDVDYFVLSSSWRF